MLIEDKIIKITSLYSDYYHNKITLGALHDGIKKILEASEAAN